MREKLKEWDEGERRNLSEERERIESLGKQQWRGRPRRERDAVVD